MIDSSVSADGPIRHDHRPRIRLIGLPTDSHSSFLRGAAAAPAAIRAALGSDHGNSTAENGLELGDDIALDDVGDLPLDETVADVDRIRDACAAAARARGLWVTGALGVADPPPPNHTWRPATLCWP